MVFKVLSNPTHSVILHFYEMEVIIIDEKCMTFKKSS